MIFEFGAHFYFYYGSSDILISSSRWTWSNTFFNFLILSPLAADSNYFESRAIYIFILNFVLSNLFFLKQNLVVPSKLCLFSNFLLHIVKILFKQ